MRKQDLPNHLTRAQIARALELPNYYRLPPIMRIAIDRKEVHPISVYGVMMLPVTDLPALRKIKKEIENGRSARK